MLAMAKMHKTVYADVPTTCVEMINILQKVCTSAVMQGIYIMGNMDIQNAKYNTNTSL